MKYLNRLSSLNLVEDTVICVALCHNELNILQEFLDHYRSISNISFLIVDDRSDDGSTNFLLDQHDVTLFQPVSGSTYREHKRFWRQELLDEYGDGKWCIVPDIDEHFVYLDMENKPLKTLISEMESEGARVMHGIMLDMYANKPIANHIYTGGKLLSSFPYFDGAESYWTMSTPKSFQKKFPTPSVMVFGGMRDRLFYSNKWLDLFVKKVFRRYTGLPFHEARNRIEKVKYEFIRRIVHYLSEDHDIPLLNSSKLPLIKWEKGLYYNGGAHAINKSLQIYSQSAALLHYRFTRGISGLEYSAKRGQHAEKGSYIKRILRSHSALKKIPVTGSSKKFVNSFSLMDVLE